MTETLTAPPQHSITSTPLLRALHASNSCTVIPSQNPHAGPDGVATRPIDSTLSLPCLPTMPRICSCPNCWTRSLPRLTLSSWLHASRYCFIYPSSPPIHMILTNTSSAAPISVLLETQATRPTMSNTLDISTLHCRFVNVHRIPNPRRLAAPRHHPICPHPQSDANNRS